jgi:very-short-patch-repair endonuclease
MHTTRGANSFGAPGGGIFAHALALASTMANGRARNLRRNMSDAERKLWHALRAKQLDGVRFRRQHPIGRYIADFVCLERRLIVEVDGGQHTEDDQMARDARRDRWLQAEGYRVLRVPTADIYGNIADVLDTIWGGLREVRAQRHPRPERHRA